MTTITLSELWRAIIDLRDESGFSPHYVVVPQETVREWRVEAMLDSVGAEASHRLRRWRPEDGFLAALPDVVPDLVTYGVPVYASDDVNGVTVVEDASTLHEALLEEFQGLRR